MNEMFFLLIITQCKRESENGGNYLRFRRHPQASLFAREFTHKLTHQLTCKYAISRSVITVTRSTRVTHTRMHTLRQSSEFMSVQSFQSVHTEI